MMKNLKELINCRRDLILDEENQITCLYEDLQMLSNFLKDLQEKFYGHEVVKNLRSRIRDVEYEAENILDLFVVNAASKKEEHKKKKKNVMTKLKTMMMNTKKKDVLDLAHVKQEIEAIKQEVMEIYRKRVDEMAVTEVGTSSIGESSIANTHTSEDEITVGVKEDVEITRDQLTSIANTQILADEIIVGFEEELTRIKDQLTGGSKRLQVVSIVGMAGLGKTTLARKVYNDPLVLYHFYSCAWIFVSQEYRKRELLHRLLSSVMQHTDGIDQMSEEELAQKLCKSLKGRRYLIVMDDIWDVRAWFDFKTCFPNDNNGSRILLTSRHGNVALLAKPNCPPLSLRFLTDDESWDLIQRKVFRRETCPPQLMQIGKKIANKCQGLPLAIVLVAGILTNEEKSQERWKQVGETLYSHVAAGLLQWTKTLALSYNHLPHHLRQCFLYFAIFPEDFQVPVWKLIGLWVAEGFIRKTGEKTLEDVAEEYLTDLIGRSLILVSQTRYDGGVKACGIHDSLRDFCIKQAEKEGFLHRYSHRDQVFSSSNSECLSIDDSLGVWTTSSIFIFSPNTQTFACFNSRCTCSQLPYSSQPCYELLKVLDASFRIIRSYPNDIGKLVRLRYLAIGTLLVHSETHVPASISNLRHLETLIIDARSSVILPHCIRKMVKLRHIRFTGPGTLQIEGQDPHTPYPFSMDVLQTLSWVDPWSCGDFLAGTPNLRKLGFRGRIAEEHVVNHLQELKFPDIDFLNHLQELKLFNTCISKSGGWSANLGGIRFPANLKKLTLARTFLNWDEMCTLGKSVPKLEVLKLLQDACKGPVWETCGGFPQLKCLKFDSLDVVQWNASAMHFPRLHRLSVVGCYWLENIPSEMGDIPTLEMIEVHLCNLSLANSAREIKEEQESMGNTSLQVVTPVICRTTGDVEVSTVVFRFRVFCSLMLLLPLLSVHCYVGFCCSAS